jgi:hypothetical protein
MIVSLRRSNCSISLGAILSMLESTNAFNSSKMACFLVFSATAEPPMNIPLYDSAAESPTSFCTIL